MNLPLEMIFPWALVAAGGFEIDPADGLAGLLIAFAALTAMEIVLGIDNIIFISIVVSRLPHHQQKTAGLLA